MEDKKKILLVDDNAALCFAMGEYFKLLNYHVECAHSVQECELRLKLSRYVVVVADLELSSPGTLDGIKVIKMVRDQFPETPIIVLTAYGSTDVENVALSSGANVIMHKPRQLSDVARVISELTGNL